MANAYEEKIFYGVASDGSGDTNSSKHLPINIYVPTVATPG